MKLSTILISLAILTGCATSVVVVSMYRAPDRERSVTMTKPIEETADEPRGGGSPPPVAAPMPAPIMAPPPPPPRNPAADAMREPRVNRKPVQVKPNPEKVADDIMSQLEPANMVFGVDPKRSNISDSISVTMLIDLSKNIQDLKASVKNSEIVTASRIEVSKVVVARVIAPDFKVVAITPEEQPISHFETTKWEWELVPLKTGKHQIHVTVNAEVQVEGVRKVRSIETFRETVEIEITAWQVIKFWIANYWQWSFTTLILPLGLWLYKKKKAE